MKANIRPRAARQKGEIYMKLAYSNVSGLYYIEEKPGLIVLGVEHGGAGTTESPRWFEWVNGEIEAMETPEELVAALHDEPEYITVEADEFPSDPPARALVVDPARLWVHVGGSMPSTPQDGWSLVQKLVHKYLEYAGDIYLYLNETAHGKRFYRVHGDSDVGRLLPPDRTLRVLGPATIGPGPDEYRTVEDAVRWLADAARIDLDDPSTWDN